MNDGGMALIQRNPKLQTMVPNGANIDGRGAVKDLPQLAVLIEGAQSKRCSDYLPPNLN